MTGRELLVRARQQWLKRMDLWRYRLHLEPRTETIEISAEPSFLFERSDLPDLRSTLLKLFPLEVKTLIRRADRICEHRFDLLGYEDLDYGSAIDWHLDLVNSRRAPFKPWYKIHYLDFSRVGDSKVTWELNRLQHMVTLAKAFRLIGESRYLSEIEKQFHSWREKNPYPFGINWASSLEVAFRSLSLLWLEHLVQYSEMPGTFWKEVEETLALSARHIANYLSTYFSPNTHLLGEAVALFFIGTLHPEFKSSVAWRELGWKIVLQEAARQVQSDGMHFEQSVHYHVYAIDFFLHARLLAARNSIAIPASFDAVLERMLDALLAVSSGGSPPPRLGDDDGGRLFDPLRNRAEHMTDPLAVGAVLFRRGDFKRAAKSLREETVWLLGPGCVKTFDDLPAEDKPPLSTVLTASGIYVLSSSNATLVADAGPQGTGTAGHGHADALSLCLTSRTRQLLVDPGTFVYVSGGKEREQFRDTKAHNTFQADGADQSQPVSPFAWRNLPNVAVRCWHGGNRFDLFAGTHDGYTRLPKPVIHTRWIFHRKDGFWLIRDVVTGVGLHQLDLHYHLAPGLHADVVDPSTIVIRDKQEPYLAIVTPGPSEWCRDMQKGWVSPAYGIKEPAEIIHFGRRGTVPAEFVTVLRPVTDLHCIGTVSHIDGASPAEAKAYRYLEQDVHYVCFAETGTKQWRAGACASNAQFAYWSVSNGELAQFVLCGGSWLEFEGRIVFSSQEVVEWYESGLNIRALANTTEGYH